MWDWLEKLLELINRYGFPFVTAALFLIIIPFTLRGLWREYRNLTKRHTELLIETTRFIELSTVESEIAMQTITATLQRITDIRKKLDLLIQILNDEDAVPR